MKASVVSVVACEGGPSATDRLLFWARVLTAFAMLAGARARAQPSVQECVAASTSGQEHLRRGALFSARTAFERCSDTACPRPVGRDCTQWLEEVIAAMPSLNVVVRLNGVDQAEAHVDLDGSPWFEQLTGRPQELEPGQHEVSVRVGSAHQSQRVLVVQGEKNRVLAFQLVDVVTKAQQTTSAVRPFPVGPVVLTGLALGAFGSFAGFGFSGKGQLNRLLDDPCAQTQSCDPARLLPINRDFLVADVSLGVGVATAVAAVVWWWWWAAHPVEKDVGVRLMPQATPFLWAW